MRRELWAAAALATLIGSTASAQVNNTGPYRRFTDDVGDVNRSNRIGYVPLAWAFSEARPARQPYDESSATWYIQPVGARGVKPDKVLDKADYTLDEFAWMKQGNGAPDRLRVVITRIGGPAEPAPELRLVHPETHITTRARANVTPVAGGSRYTFELESPLGRFQPSSVTQPNRFEVRFMASHEVSRRTFEARSKPTFSGEDPQLRALSGPPRLPRAERVAGKRIEFRSPRSAGVVVEDTERVAGKRQQFRNKR